VCLECHYFGVDLVCVIMLLVGKCLYLQRREVCLNNYFAQYFLKSRGNKDFRSDKLCIFIYFYYLFGKIWFISILSVAHSHIFWRISLVINNRLIIQIHVFVCT
jgi:hypothetical protein